MLSDLEEGFLMGLNLIRLWGQSKDFPVGAPLLPSSKFCADFSGRQPQSGNIQESKFGEMSYLSYIDTVQICHP